MLIANILSSYNLNKPYYDIPVMEFVSD